ncbi:MAG: GntR family transcriptional regulator [Thermoleophilia bacterium]
MELIERTSLAQRVYTTLLGAIVRGELAPGTRVRDTELAAKLGVSRTPVREALLRLGHEGLIESQPGSHSRVAEFDADAVSQAYLVAATLHGLAARLAAQRLTAADLRAMERANEERNRALRRGDIGEAIAADDRLHMVLVDRADNPELRAALERVMPKVRRIDHAHFLRMDPEGSTREHEAIIEACRAADAAEAERLVEANFLAIGASICEVLRA